jgi:outer membrane protein assembly factor BamB
VVGDRVFTIGHDGNKRGGKETVYCLDAKTGDTLWSDTYDAQLLPRLHEGGPAATPTVHGDRVFTLGKDGRLGAYLAETGESIWSRDVLVDSAMEKPAEWGFAGSPLVVGDTLVVEAAHTIAYNIADGEIVWKSDRFKPAYATPTYFEHDGRALLVTLKTEGLMVLDAKTGKTVAQTEWKTRFSTNATTPIVVGDQIYISTGYGRGCALYRFDGKAMEEIYTNKAMSNHMANCVLIDGHLFGVTGNTHGAEKKELVCMEFATGAVKWTHGGFRCGTVAAAGDRLIVLGEKGELAIAKASPDAFEEISRAQITNGRCWTAPVLSGGRIYTRNAAGKLVVVDVRP